MTRNRRTWIFNCADTFSGNPKWMFLYIVNQRPDIEAIWVSESEECVRFVRSLGFKAEVLSSRKGIAVQRRAGVFVVNQVKERIPVDMTGILLLNLWHGVGVKTIERRLVDGDLLPRIAGKYIRNNKAYRDTQHFLVTSPAMESHFTSQVGLREDQLIRGSYPQNIYQRRFGAFRSFDHDVRTRQGLSADTRLAMYAPTFRTIHDGSSFLHAAFPHPEALIDTLRETNTLLILKMHPHMASDTAFQQLRTKYADEAHLLFWENSDDIYEIFPEIDLAIIDYSSIHYDLLAAGLNRFIRYAFDRDQEGVFNHSSDYLDLSAGTLADSFDELLTALRSENRISSNDRERLMDHFWAFDNDQTFELLIEAGLTRDIADNQLPNLYSFDIFDTVIGRTTIEPISVFHRVQELISESDLGFPADLRFDFVRIRTTAEKAVRERNRKNPALEKSKAFEIHFFEIYDRISSLYGLSAPQRDQLMVWEVDTELSVTRPIPQQVARVKSLINTGSCVVFISDMYLPEAVVRELLMKADPELANVPLYLSSTRGVQKTTGRLYLEVYKEQPYDYAEWRHIGDNPHADEKPARALGIVTRRLPQAKLSPYEWRVVRSLKSFDGFQVAGMHYDKRISDHERPPVHDFAYHYIAPYLVPYVLWVIEDALERGYKSLYFLARDGYHLKRIADEAIRLRGLDLKTKYVYGSRQAWRLAAQVDNVDDEVFGPFGSFGGATSVEAFARQARLTLDEFIDIIPAAKPLAGEKHLTPAQQRAIRGACAASIALRLHLLDVGQHERTSVLGYMNQEIDFGEPFAIVEFWGRGYTQDCLGMILRTGGLLDGALPFYYARSIYDSSEESIRHNFTSSAFSMLVPETLFANLDYGTTEGYTQEEGHWVPITSPRNNNPALHSALEAELPAYTREFLALPLVDAPRTRRALFTFAFDYFQSSPTDAAYVEHLAPLRDAVALGEAEREFAPALDIKLFLRYLNRHTRSSVSRNWKMTSVRTKGLPRLLLKAQQRFGFRRIIRRLRGAPSPAVSSTWLFSDELLNDVAISTQEGGEK
ncbi:CDP-glycerol glycerophosphotransferase family protein [Microbacterium esteraromaticum]|uniref:CDP-glycerol glycerophosphotransferase family protein n=1 Tax=Microbacterium esteraromaticum TaxID=57043 RepID=UPI002368899F|nr:CDP-glycerol glycerophosphotransferase family protein [Microbacterium esteraromaticum]WDH78726.1 CDP-glycerol glycerophosphotransferase family protein [Microbacterium esteraromaticum]